MKIRLIIPRPPVESGGFTLQSNAPLRIKVHLRRNHPASSHGLGVLLIGREIFDGHFFRALRDQASARIETDDPSAACAALGLPEGEAGIYEIKA